MISVDQAEMRRSDLQGIALQGVRFVALLARRFTLDGCFGVAGALSYTTLVSLVPLLAISLAVLSAFPIFDTLRTEVLEYVFQAFVPRIGGTIDSYISNFVQLAGKTTALGVLVLGFTAWMLLVTIEDRLNAIWRVHAPRSWAARITIYWTVLTLGPVLCGLAMSLSSGLRSFASALVSDLLSRWFSGLASLLPGAFECLALTLIYSLIPHCPVRWRDAFSGAALAAVLIEIGKAGFSFYLDHFNSYQAIYGALAAIPIFLAWIYITWCVILLGAEFAALFPLWHAGVEVERDAPPLDLALAVLQALVDQARAGGSARLRVLAHGIAHPAAAVATCLAKLTDAGYVAATRDGGYVLARDLRGASLAELKQAVEPIPQDHCGRLANHLAPLRTVEAEAMAASVASVIGG